ncbi:succinyl-diaminopimelate desuccinylase [Buchnera aphidicola]|uniref:succinyl-diaminopimelate desuccinylase n=1 Tax=Buchnera aphidicola TaxID=9 RepID=UPI003464A346
MVCPVLNLAKQLVSIPSISPLDFGCQNVIASRLLNVGFNVMLFRNNDTNNLWAYHGIDGIKLSFAGHTDVVPAGDKNNWYMSQPFVPYVKNGYLFGRGSSDMKGSLAAMVVAAERFVTLYPHHPGQLSFLITSDEESDAVNGTIRIIEYLKFINFHINYCIIGEPTSKNIFGDTIKIGRRGSLHAHLFIYGKQGHIAYPQFSINPIHQIIPFLNELMLIKWSIGNSFFKPTSMQISNINSGLNSDNVTPEQLSLKFNFRFGTDILVKDIKKQVLFLLEKYNLNYSIKWKLSGMPFLTSSKILVNFIKNSLQKYGFINPTLSTSGGTSDGRFIKNISSEILEFGPINKTIHQVNECIKIRDLKFLSLVYEDVMKNILC